jgi:hypothetical protein
LRLQFLLKRSRMPAAGKLAGVVVMPVSLAPELRALCGRARRG